MGTRIKEARRRAGLSQVDLAGRLGIKQQSVQKWEAGTATPAGGRLQALAQALGCTVDYLMTGREDPPPTSPAGAQALDDDLEMAALIGRLDPEQRDMLRGLLRSMLERGTG